VLLFLLEVSAPARVCRSSSQMRTLPRSAPDEQISTSLVLRLPIRYVRACVRLNCSSCARWNALENHEKPVVIVCLCAVAPWEWCSWSHNYMVPCQIQFPYESIPNMFYCMLHLPCHFGIDGLAGIATSHCAVVAICCHRMPSFLCLSILWNH
jgi:hypothetical protein